MEDRKKREREEREVMIRLNREKIGRMKRKGGSERKEVRKRDRE